MHIFKGWDIGLVMPVQFKNWLTVLSVYETISDPTLNFPLFPNPIVESTFTIDSPIWTSSVHLEFGVGKNLPLISESSSYPTKRLC